VLDAVVTTAFEDVAKAHEIALDVGRWVLNRVAHARLSRQVYDLLRIVLREGCLHRLAILKIGLNQLKAGVCALCDGLQLRDARPLQGGVVVGVHVVEPHHRRAPLQQPRAQVKADEAGGAGDKNGHAGRKRKKEKNRELTPP